MLIIYEMILKRNRKSIDNYGFDKNYKSEDWYSTIKGNAFHPTC